MEGLLQAGSSYFYYKTQRVIEDLEEGLSQIVLD
ncbi:hypothetical protein V6Z11_D11G172800 [Gossypium hirsutum]